VIGGIAVHVGGVALWLLWPAISLAPVALAYASIGPSAFQKHGPRHSIASAWLFAPYTVGARINARLWTLRQPDAHPICDGVWIGRMPTRREWRRRSFAAMVDLCAELPAPAGVRRHHALAWLDLAAPSPDALRAAAATIEAARREGDVLVCCALGYGRSACAVAAWLVSTGRAPDANAAFSHIRRNRPDVVAPPNVAAFATLPP
jgi:hypothetical protein